jgi:large subunit ribosomal protein L10
VKNSFLKRAMADSGMPDVADKLVGQTAIVMGENDVAPVAKILKLFAAEFKIATLKIGVVDKEILSTADVEALAELPSREILLSQLLRLLLAPATRLVRVLNEPASAFARLLSAKADKEEASAAATPAPAAEAPAPAAETPAPAAEIPAPAAETQAPAPSANGAPTPEAAEAKQEAPVTEAKEEAAAEQTPAAETPTAESTNGERATETPA